MTLNGSLRLDEKLCLTRYSATNVVNRRYYEPLRVLGLTYLDSWHCSYQGDGRGHAIIQVKPCGRPAGFLKHD